MRTYSIQHRAMDLLCQLLAPKQLKDACKILISFDNGSLPSQLYV